MNWYIFAAYTAGLALMVGIILLSIWYALEKKRDKKRFDFFNSDVATQMAVILLDAIEAGMDMIPEKLKDIKQEMEDGADYDI